jgi:hypothetical protein
MVLLPIRGMPTGGVEPPSASGDAVSEWVLVAGDYEGAGV